MTNAQTSVIAEDYVLFDGARMRYLHAGSGPALILVHGLMGHSFSWRHCLPVFSKHFSTYAVDMLGYGYSDRPKVDQSLRANAERLLKFMDEIGSRSATLLGSSRGGGVVMRAAAIAPERVERMVLVSPINPWSPHGTTIAPFLAHPLTAPAFAFLGPRATFFHGMLLRRLYGDPSRIQPGVLEGYAAPYKIAGSFDQEIAILKTWNQDLAELGTLLPRIADLPTLLLWGNLDAAVSPASAEPLRKNFRRCKFVMMDGVGHIPYEEVPGEFDRIVLEFLLAPPPAR